MNARGFSQSLLQPGALPSARNVIEASVHRPHRGRIWVATYRDGSGRQFWRSTGLTDRSAAMIVAQELERAARRERSDQANLIGEPVVRLRHGSGKSGPGLTQREVGLILRISERAVREIERRAIDKLRCHPVLRAIWRQIGEAVGSAEDLDLSRAEMAALYALARTPAERQALRKLVSLAA
jgi:hypothetical protein